MKSEDRFLLNYFLSVGLILAMQAYESSGTSNTHADGVSYVRPRFVELLGFLIGMFDEDWVYII